MHLAITCVDAWVITAIKNNCFPAVVYCYVNNLLTVVRMNNNIYMNCYSNIAWTSQ